MTGAIVGDESFFDTARLGPGWKASFYKDECPPLSALIVNRAHFRGYITSRPALAAAKILRSKLVERGIEVGRAREARARGSELQRSWPRNSPPLSAGSCARWTTRATTSTRRCSRSWSARSRPTRARPPRERRSFKKELRSRDVPMRGVVISDGSGLSAYDRLTARAARSFSARRFRTRRSRTRSWTRLPTAGVNGTLVDRMTSGAGVPERVRKDGHDRLRVRAFGFRAGPGTSSRS